MALRNEIIAVLKDKNTRQIAFGFGPVSVSAADYLQVAGAIKNKTIAVVHNKNLGRNQGRYIYKPRNKFAMGFNRISANQSRMALVVHEASHACFDLRQLKLKVKESEAGAYIAQALFLYYSWGYDEEDLSKPTFSTPILDAAWTIAESLGKGGKVENDHLSVLYDRIGDHPHYSGRLDADETFDG